MLLQADAAGDTNMIHWAGPHFPNINHHFYLFSTFLRSPQGISVCPDSPAVLCLSLPLLSLFLSLSLSASASPVPRPWCCMNFSDFSILYSHCCKIHICVFHIRSGVFAFVVSLSPSRYSFRPVSLSFFFCTRPTLSKRVTSCKPGPAQGFSLLKGSFSLPLCLPGGSGAGFLTL